MSAATTATHTDDFIERLQKVAFQVAAWASKPRISVGMSTISPQDYKDDALSFTFEAFIDLGGDPDHPENFNWERRDFIRLAARKLRRSIQAKGSFYYDLDCRLRNRLMRNPSICWDIWRHFRWDWPYINEEDEATSDAPQEQEMLRKEVGAVLYDLERLLSPRDFQLLVLHYAYGRTQVGLARELGIEEGTANQVLSRARRRARQRLDPRWALIAAEVV